VQFFSLPEFFKQARVTQPFPTLLDDDEELLSYKRRHPRGAAMTRAERLALQAQQEIQDLISELQTKAIQEKVNWKDITEAKYLVAQTLMTLQEITAQGIPALEKALILSSSWLLGAIARFSTSSEDHADHLAKMDRLILGVSQFLNRKYLTARLQKVARLLRHSLLLVPDELPAQAKNFGTLYLSILKRKNPKKIDGPYFYPNLPWETWRRMQAAKGQNGSGAGTVLWREYLHPLKGRVI